MQARPRETEGYRRESQVHPRLNEAKSNFTSFVAKPRVGLALGAHAALGAEDACPGWPALTLVLKRHFLCLALILPCAEPLKSHSTQPFLFERSL